MLVGFVKSPLTHKTCYAFFIRKESFRKEVSKITSYRKIYKLRPVNFSTYAEILREVSDSLSNMSILSS